MKTTSEIIELANNLYPPTTLVNKRLGYMQGYQDGQQHGRECAKAENKQVSASFLRWVIDGDKPWFIYKGMAYSDWEDDGTPPIEFEQLFEIYLKETQNAKTVQE